MGLLPLQYLHWVTWSKALATTQVSGVYSRRTLMFLQSAGLKVKSMAFHGISIDLCILLPPRRPLQALSIPCPINLGTVLSFLLVGISGKESHLLDIIHPIQNSSN